MDIEEKKVEQQELNEKELEQANGGFLNQQRCINLLLLQKETYPQQEIY